MVRNIGWLVAFWLSRKDHIMRSFWKQPWHQVTGNCLQIGCGITNWTRYVQIVSLLDVPPWISESVTGEAIQSGAILPQLTGGREMDRENWRFLMRESAFWCCWLWLRYLQSYICSSSDCRSEYFWSLSWDLVCKFTQTWVIHCKVLAWSTSPRFSLNGVLFHILFIRP